MEFRALGPVEAVVAGQPADLGPPKQRMLLTLLVGRISQPVSVDVLMEELWAGRQPPSAVASLQAYVANLRRVLEPARAPRTPAKVLRTGGGGYLLDGSVVDVDVRRFEECATAGWQRWDRGEPQRALSEFESALALWRGQAYAEMPNTSRVMPEAARLEELRLSVVEGRCAALLAVGAHEVAVAELEAFTQAHPLREYGCELLSRALYRAGRQADALAVLRTNQKRLADELGIDPRPALQNLEREILNQAPALDCVLAPAVRPTATLTGPVGPARVRRTGPPPSPGPEGDIFVGRETALRQLSDALAAARAGHGQVVTISGEPGVGKTALLRRFAMSTEVPVLWGAAPSSMDTPPLWPWQQVLRSAVICCPTCVVPAPVAELLDPDAPPPAEGGEPAATMRRFEAIVHYLTDACRATPLVIALDHLHRADRGSLCLLAHLAESVPASRLLVAAAFQSGAAAAETSAALARSEITRVELTGFAIQDIQALVKAMLHQDVGWSAAEELRARTEGNPFFLRELIKLADSQGCPDLPHTVPVPASVRAMVLGTVAQLPQAAADLLVVASVAGRQFSIDVVAEAASIESEAALGLVETIVAAGMIVEDQQRLGWFHFAHALVAEVLCETVGRLRRVYLRRRIDAAAARVWTGTIAKSIESAWRSASRTDPGRRPAHVPVGGG